MRVMWIMDPTRWDGSKIPIFLSTSLHYNSNIDSYITRNPQKQPSNLALYYYVNFAISYLISLMVSATRPDLDTSAATSGFS